MQGKLVIFAILFSLMSGCATRHISSSPELADLSTVNKPESAGPNVALDFNSAIFEQTLYNSDYFASVKEGSGSRSDITLKVRYSKSDDQGAIATLSAVGALFTIGIIPFILPTKETFYVDIIDKEGNKLKENVYVFEQAIIGSFWPHVYLFGANDDRARRNQYSIITSNIIKNLDELGLMHSNTNKRY